LDTILLVNDSTTLTKVLSSHFQKAGYRVIAVTGVMDAYEAFIRTEIDLILTDYVLRDKDGLEVIKTFRSKRNQKTLPIVVFTAMEDEETAKRCKDAGASTVLCKAAGTANLLESIEKGEKFWWGEKGLVAAFEDLKVVMAQTGNYKKMRYGA
jgi:DNA-binding response OmpR family regulator